MRLSERILGQFTLFFVCMFVFWWPNLAILNLFEVYIGYVPMSKLIALLIMPIDLEYFDRHHDQQISKEI
jgi:hypothetical protein